MEGSHASVNTCELVTGVVVDGQVVKTIEFRELAGPEEDILAAEKMKYSDRITRILQNCTIKIGAVQDRKSINQLIEQLVTADRWYYLVQLRVLSVGKDYVFESVCPECNFKDKVIYDLSQVTVKSELKADKLMIETKVGPKNRVVRWKAADGKTEAKIETMTKDDQAVTTALYARIESIDDKPSSFDDVRNMTMRERRDLEKDIKKIEGSIDDEVEFTCPKCAHQYKGDLPLDGRSFFYPQE